ncbi:MAG: tRNA pseudouridine 55 synthase [Armatimonadetes bacterium]|jgi:tRNA pseudouridine55 synthase|nr:tRNA pseudouridine 55 synthase [Armatimonadota bacterium]
MSASGSDNQHGILNLYKPTGPTSHDCVGRVRRVMGTRRVGHAGTLDPMARGVLVIGIGNGTRILEYLQGQPKVYRARVVFGVTTDSQDTTGVVLSEADASAVTREEVASRITALVGDLLQVPPMVSALKVGGRRLYELARKGETVERAPRPVTIYQAELLDFQPGPRAEAEFRVTCSAGTYVRTLCHDLGDALGTGAAMSALEREAVGELRVEDAVPLDDLQPGTPLLPLGAALRHLPALTVSDEDAIRLGHGQFVPAPEDAPEGPLRVLAPHGALLAIATVRGQREARLIAPDKVFSYTDASHTGS